MLKCVVKYFAALLDPANAEKSGHTVNSVSEIFGCLFLRRDPRKPRPDAFLNDEVERSLATQFLACLLENRSKLFSESVLELKRRRHRIPLAYKHAIKELLGAIDSVSNLKEWEKKVGVFPEDDSDDEGEVNAAINEGDGVSSSVEATEKRLGDILADVDRKLEVLK